MLVTQLMLGSHNTRPYSCRTLLTVLLRSARLLRLLHSYQGKRHPLVRPNHEMVLEPGGLVTKNLGFLPYSRRPKSRQIRSQDELALPRVLVEEQPRD